MRLQVTRYAVQIIPETPQDEAFLEIILGFNDHGIGDTAIATRVNVIGMGALAYVELKKP